MHISWSVFRDFRCIEYWQSSCYVSKLWLLLKPYCKIVFVFINVCNIGTYCANVYKLNGYAVLFFFSFYWGISDKYRISIDSSTVSVCVILKFFVLFLMKVHFIYLWKNTGSVEYVKAHCTVKYVTWVATRSLSIKFHFHIWIVLLADEHLIKDL